MYKMPSFTEKDQQPVLDFMHTHPFVTLIGTNSNDLQPVATQVPVMLEEKNGKLTITGHIMKHTDHYTAMINNTNVLVLFQGAHTYVSASWYAERGHGSTWNYMTIHVNGEIHFLGEEDTIRILTQLTHQYEDKQAMPELVEQMSEDYIRGNVKAIAGFEIAVSAIYPIFKLSQNRDDKSYQEIVKQLSLSEDCGAGDMVKEMKQRRPHLFEIS